MNDKVPGAVEEAADYIVAEIDRGCDEGKGRKLEKIIAVYRSQGRTLGYLISRLQRFHGRFPTAVLWVMGGFALTGLGLLSIVSDVPGLHPGLSYFAPSALAWKPSHGGAVGYGMFRPYRAGLPFTPKPPRRAIFET